jgi:hypothetical protein
VNCWPTLSGRLTSIKVVNALLNTPRIYLLLPKNQHRMPPNGNDPRLQSLPQMASGGCGDSATLL